MVSIYAMCGGLIDLDRSGFFCDVAPGTRLTVPVISFLINHPKGHVVVDTGVHRQAISDPVGRLGERRAGLFRIRSAASDEVATGQSTRYSGETPSPSQNCWNLRSRGMCSSEYPSRASGTLQSNSSSVSTVSRKRWPKRWNCRSPTP